MIPSAAEKAVLAGIVLALALAAWLSGQVAVIAVAPLVVVVFMVGSEVLHRRAGRSR